MLVTTATLSAVPALAAPSGAVAGSPSPALLSLTAELAQAEAEFEKVLKVVEATDRAMFQWKAEHPRPEMRECQVPCSGPDPNADLKTAIAEHSQELKAWSEKQTKAFDDCGEPEAKRLENETGGKVWGLAKQIEAAPCNTLADLRIKAMVARDMESDEMAWSVLDHLLSITS